MFEEKQDEKGVWRKFLRIVGEEKKLGVCELCLRGVERAGACCIIKTSPTPSQLCCTQNCRNEGTMNGFHCVTMTAAFSGKATVRGLSCRDAAPSVCVCVRVYTEKLPRNVRIHAKDKEFAFSSPSEEISQSHQKACPDSHTG